MMALHEQLTKEGSKIKSLCAEPGVAQTELAANLLNGHNQAGNGEKIKPVMEGMATKYSGLQSCADGACALMMAAFAADVSSGDFCEWDYFVYTASSFFAANCTSYAGRTA